MEVEKEKRWVVSLFTRASSKNEYKTIFDSVFKNEERAKRYAFIKNVQEGFQFDRKFGYSVHKIKRIKDFEVTDEDREKIMEFMKDRINSIGHIRGAKIDIVNTIEALKGILFKEQIKELHKEIREVK